MNQVEIIKINSNLTNKKVIITLAFKYGYLDESDNEFGYCHLAEHYICSVLESKYKLGEVYGSVDNDYILINIDSTKKKLADLVLNLKKILNEIISLEINKKIFENEKNRFITEINNLYIDIDNQIFEEISNKTIKQPKKIVRRKIDQVKNINKINQSLFQKTIENIIKSPSVIFIDQKENNNPKKLSPKNIFIKNLKVDFVKKKKIKIDINNPYYKSNFNQFLFFKGLNHKSTTIEKFSLRFILQESMQKLEKQLQDEGVYEIQYDNYILNNFGFFWFLVSSNKKSDFNLIKCETQIINNLLQDEKLDTKLNKFKKEQIKNIKSSWKIEENRNPWIIEDLLETGKISDLETLEKEINKISKKDLIKINSKLFKETDAYMLENR